MPARAQRTDQLPEQVERIPERRQVRDLAADVHVYAGHLDAW